MDRAIASHWPPTLADDDSRTNYEPERPYGVEHKGKGPESRLVPTGAASVEGSWKGRRAECKELSGDQEANGLTNQCLSPRILYRSGFWKYQRS